MIRLHLPAICPGDSQLLEAYPLGIEHSKNVVVGNDEQIRRRTEPRLSVSEERWVNMPMGAYQREVSYLLVEFHGHPPLGRVRLENTFRDKVEFFRAHSASFGSSQYPTGLTRWYALEAWSNPDRV
jgi:hypothetical protein